MAKHVVARAAEILPGQRRLIKIQGRTIGIFNVAGQYYALKNSCIHEGAPVCLGTVTGTFQPSAPGEFHYGHEGEVLRCPWHGWEFFIASGGSVFNPEVKLKTYPVTVEGDQIIVDL
ncbi:MAG: Rieske (2Fe-2S) protein [Chloroflexi bacterium]|nr:Rieske (2Fe-2S) protein [Chloroflexota bacterium]